MKSGVAKPVRAKLSALNKPVVIVLLVCLCLVAFNIVVAQQHRAYNSDDLSWQTTLMSWRPFSGENAYVGAKDNFVVNLPFIVLADHLFAPGRGQLLAASLMMALVNFALFYVASLYFLRLAKVKLSYRTLLPFVWLASFGYALSSLFLNTVWRDYEVGVSFVYYALAAGYYVGRLRPFEGWQRRLVSLLFLLVSACFVSSDPYFLYFTVVPVALFFGVQYVLGKVSRRKLAIVLGWSVAVWVVAKLLTAAFAAAGIVRPRGAPTTFMGLSYPRAALGHLVDSFSSIFGARLTWLAAANLLLLVVIMGLILWALWPKGLVGRLKKGGTGLWLGFFGVLALLVTAAALAVDQGGIYTYRYLLLDVYAFVLILALSAKTMKRWSMMVITGVLLVATLCNVSLTYGAHIKAVAQTPPNSNNLQIAAAVRGLGLHKGYAGYWDANINTYYARDINFLPVMCTKSGKIIATRFLVNGALFDRLSRRSFVVVNPTMYPPLCTEKQMITQFGQPAQTVQAAGLTIWVYNYDLITKMPHYSPPIP